MNTEQINTLTSLLKKLEDTNFKTTDSQRLSSELFNTVNVLVGGQPLAYICYAFGGQRLCIK